MPHSLPRSCVLAACLAAGGLTLRAAGPNSDFGAFIAHQLRAHSEQLFGFRHPLEESALGPYDGPDSTQAIQVAQGLRVSLVSSGVASAADQIALWPDDDHPTHVFVCEPKAPNAREVRPRHSSIDGWKRCRRRADDFR